MYINQQKDISPRLFFAILPPNVFPFLCSLFYFSPFTRNLSLILLELSKNKTKQNLNLNRK